MEKKAGIHGSVFPSFSFVAMTVPGRLLLLAILQDDRQLYGIERLFDSQQFECLELALSANCGPSQSVSDSLPG
jgi:hypothetical protein